MYHLKSVKFLAFMAILLVGGCGGSGIDVDLLAKDRLNAYVSFYEDIGEILENNSGEESVPKLKALKEKYVQMFGRIGRNHAKLTKDERLEFVRVWNRIEKENPQYAEVQKLRHRGYRHMEGWTQETVDLIDEYSVIPGYADSTNLKATRPEVAKRLGIE